MITTLIIWLIGAIIAFFTVINKWDKTIAEKIIYSLIWPMLLVFYLIHVIYNKCHKKKEEEDKTE